MRIDIPEVANFPSTPYWRMLVLDYYFNGHFGVSEDVKARREQQKKAQLSLKEKRKQKKDKKSK